MNARRVIILGAGGFARETLDIVEATAAAGGPVEALGFVVDREYFQPHTVINDLPVLGDFDWLAGNLKGVHVVCAVGDPPTRRRLVETALRVGAEFTTLVHPAAHITRRATLGVGCVVTAGVAVTCNIAIGDHVHLNLNTTVGHDSRLASYVTCSPGVHVSGGVALGEGAFIGTGAVILEQRVVGEWSVVGASALVNRDVPANCTAVGVPAGIIKQRDPGWHLV